MFLTRLRFLSAGESHGPRLTAIIDGLPAGFPIDPAAIDEELRRRQTGFGSGGRMKIEQDRVTITSGWMAGLTTGGPLAVTIANRDWTNWATKDIPPMTKPRPGHADLTGALKYGHKDLRLSLERASARETAMRVAIGGVCKQVLGAFGVEVGGYVVSLGDVTAELPPTDAAGYRGRFADARENDVSCPDAAAVEPMRDLVSRWRKAKDTVGGVFEVVALGVPPGLGTYAQWDRRLDARLTAALVSIQAIKGVEIGPAFENATKKGTEVHDAIIRDDRSEAGRLRRETNRAGGVEGGISTGEPIVLRAAKKPISTTLDPRRTVDLATGEPALTTYERSDFCAVPRAVPIGEAMVALVLCDALLEKLGGDGLAEMRPRFEALRTGRLDELELDNTPWRFGYPE